MSNRIIEAQEKMADAAASVEKKARQLVYDARYEVNNQLRGKNVAPAVKLKMILDRIIKSTAIPAVKNRAKEMVAKKPVKEEYIIATEDTASDSVASAMFKVFVEGVEKKEEIQLVYEEEARSAKYHIRVTDPKTGRTYTRKADRQKITELRAKGLKVEMSEYRDSSETKREGEKVAKKRAKRDYDGDGKVESSSKEHAGAVHNAIQRAKGGNPDGRDTRKEDFLWNEGATGTTSTEGQNSKKLDIMKSTEANKVTLFPEVKEEVIAEKAKSKAQQRFMGMVYATKKGKKAPSPEVAAAAKGMSKKEAKKYASTEHEGLPEKKKDKKKKSKMNEEATCPKCGKSPCECDIRGNQTYRELLKNKLRAMGKKVMAACGDEENLEKSYDDMMTASFVKTNRETGKLEPVHVFKEDEDRDRDKRQERGGVGANVKYDRSPAKKLSNDELGIKPGKTWVQKQMEKKKNK